MVSALAARVPASRIAAGKRLLIGVCVLFLGIFLLVPLGCVFAVALGQGIAAYLQAFPNPDTISSIRLTLLAAAIAVP